MKNLQARIMIIFSSVFLIFSIFLSWQNYHSSTNLIAKSLGLQAQTIAENAAKMIDPERYKDITPETGATDYYKELRESFNEMKETNGLKYLYSMNRNKNGDHYEYFYVVDAFPLNSDEASKIGEVEDTSYEALINAFETKKPQYGELTHDEYGTTISAYVPFTDENGEIIGAVGADFDANSIYKTIQKEKWKTVIISALILMIGLLVIFLFARYLLKPLKDLLNQINIVQKGDFTVVLETNRKDEIGALSNAFNEMIKNLKGMIQTISQNSDQLDQSSESLSNSSIQTAATTTFVNEKVTGLKSGAKRQLEIVENAAATISEMSKGIEEIAGNLDEVAVSSQNTSKVSEEGKLQIEKAVLQMKNIQVAQEESSKVIQQLEVKSREIKEIVNTITNIANQTNLLALNAAIEAARAGEHGKGFAVVSEEVRKLADESSRATERISDLIKDMGTKTAIAVLTIDNSSKEVESGTKIIASSGEAFFEILHSVVSMNEQIHSLTAVTEELASGSLQIVTVIEEVKDIAKTSVQANEDFAKIIQNQEKMVMEIESSTDNMKQMASTLTELVKTFKIS